MASAPPHERADAREHADELASHLVERLDRGDAMPVGDE